MAIDSMKLSSHSPVFIQELRGELAVEQVFAVGQPVCCIVRAAGPTCCVSNQEPPSEVTQI